MIVDDEIDFRKMFDLMMKKEGFETRTAKDGFDFLEKIDSFKPDLVTLDVNMPGITTAEIIEKLKEKKLKTKIILLTVIRYNKEETEKIGFKKIESIQEYLDNRISKNSNIKITIVPTGRFVRLKK